MMDQGPVQDELGCDDGLQLTLDPEWINAIEKTT